MRIVCGQCGATYRLDALHRARRVRCKACEGIIEIRPTENRAPAGGEEPSPVRRRAAPAAALVVAAVSLLLGLFHVLATLLVRGVDTGSSASDSSARAGLFVTIVPLSLAACLAIAAVGLFLMKPWGWWMAVVMQSFGLLRSGKFALTYLGALNWDHPKAQAIALSVGLSYGLPALFALGLLVLLFLPGVRKAYGMKQEPYRRRRPARRG